MAEKINPLVLSYPNFVLGQIIDPDEANQNNYDITNKVNELVDGAEEAIEIAESADEKAGHAKDIASATQTALSGKVDKVSGKGLSTEDYTTAEKTKLSGIATGANKYIHPTTAGNKHIPAGGDLGQVLMSNGTSGEGLWHSMVKGDISLDNVDNVKQATKTEFDTHVGDGVKHITAAERSAWVKKVAYYTTLIGDGLKTSFYFQYVSPLGVFVTDSFSGEQVYCDINISYTESIISLQFASPPTENQYRVTIIG